MSPSSFKNPIQSAIIGGSYILNNVYDSDKIDQIARLTGATPSVHETEKNIPLTEISSDTEIIYSTWGMPPLTVKMLDKLPALKGVFYAAGSVKSFALPDFWKKGITLSHAASANAIPVAEYTLGAILLANKNAFGLNQQKKWSYGDNTIPGNFNTPIGLIGYGIIARLLRDLLQPFAFDIFIYDPFLSKEEAKKDGMTKVDLDTLFKTCSVISLHAPNLKSTEKMIKEDHFASMRPHTTFINTARGQLVDEDAFIKVLSKRPDIQAIIDVTHPEPPAPNSPLFTLPNIFITPHIAGAVGNERKRLAQFMIEESARFITGSPLKYQVTEDSLAYMA